MKRIACIAPLIILSTWVLSGCTQISECGDLARWATQEAVDSGCVPDTIELNDWYSATAEGNVWFGECVDAQSGDMVELAIDVDCVWTPSGVVNSDTVSSDTVSSDTVTSDAVSSDNVEANADRDAAATAEPVASPDPERLMAGDLDRTHWTLVEINHGEPALDEPAVTLAFEGDTLGGSGDCNSYSGTFTLGEDDPFALTVGPIATTMMACPDPVGSQEAAYYAALNNAQQWEYVDGALAISYASDDASPGRLLFAPAGAPK